MRTPCIFGPWRSIKSPPPPTLNKPGPWRSIELPLNLVHEGVLKTPVILGPRRSIEAPIYTEKNFLSVHGAVDSVHDAARSVPGCPSSSQVHFIGDL